MENKIFQHRGLPAPLAAPFPHNDRCRHDGMSVTPVMASAIGHVMLTPVDHVPQATTPLLDAPAIAAALEALAKLHRGHERDMRAAVAQRLQAAIIEGRARAERLLLADRRGRLCAERLCFMQDEVIRLLFEFAKTHLYPVQNPSEAERVAIIATGGYGRGILAPGSDIDLLFLLPYKQTAWSESIAEAILYALWDMGLKVGHATLPCGNASASQGGHDHPHRDPGSASPARRAQTTTSYDFDKEVVRGTAAEFVAAKLVEREGATVAPASRYLVEVIKDGKGGLRDHHNSIGSPNTSTACRSARADQHGVYDRHSTALRRCGGMGGPLPHAFVTGRAENGCPDISARSRCSSAIQISSGDVERFEHYFSSPRTSTTSPPSVRGAGGSSRPKRYQCSAAQWPSFGRARHAERDKRFHCRLQPDRRRRRPAERIQAIRSI